MSLSSQVTKNPFSGDGVTTLFFFTFPVLDANDIEVFVVDVLQLQTAYSVAVNDDNVGGSVTLLVPPPLATGSPNGLIRRVLTLDQPEHLEDNAKLPSATLETMVDRCVMMAQQLQEQLDRTVTLDPTAPAGTNTVIPPLVASSTLNTSTDGTEMVWQPLATGVGTGNVNGPSPPGAVNSLGYFKDATGASLGAIAPGTPGQILTSNGPNSPASMQAAPAGGTTNGLFVPINIQTSARPIPGSGLLKGTYMHNGAFTSGGNYSVAHGTRMYVNGNFTIQAGHVFTGVVQSNGGSSQGKANGGQAGGGPGGGPGGYYPKGGGAGGGGYVAGGNGSASIATIAIAGGRACTTLGAGGSGGGSGAGGSKFPGAPGGGGGPFVLIEVNGNVVINESMFLDGAVGSDTSASLAGAGAGAGGGQILIRATGTITVAAGKSLFLRGGAGGSGGAGKTLTTATGLRAGGGAGGYAELTAGGVINMNGTIVTTGGAKGAGTLTPLSDAAQGANGTFDLYPNTTPISF